MRYIIPFLFSIIFVTGASAHEHGRGKGHEEHGRGHGYGHLHHAHEGEGEGEGEPIGEGEGEDTCHEGEGEGGPVGEGEGEGEVTPAEGEGEPIGEGEGEGDGGGGGRPDLELPDFQLPPLGEGEGGRTVDLAPNCENDPTIPDCFTVSGGGCACGASDVNADARLIVIVLMALIAALLIRRKVRDE